MCAGRDKQVVPWLSGSSAVSPVCLVWTAASLNSPLVRRPNNRYIKTGRTKCHIMKASKNTSFEI